MAGTAQVGETLTAEPGQWDPDARVSYQWLRDGAVINGADEQAYTLAGEDKGAKISVVVTGSKPAHESVSKTSTKTAKVKAGVLTATPTPKISGTAEVGKTLTAKAGTWAPAAVTLSYQWLRDGKSIKGATKSTYLLAADDRGKKVSVKVKGSKPGFTSVTNTSKSTAKVKTGRMSKTPTPTISGTPKVGRVLAANAGTWAPSGVALTYQWLLDGKPVRGATRSVYAMDHTDLGGKVSVQVKGEKSGFHTVWKTSSKTSVVKPGTLSATPTPTLSGTTRVGNTLTVRPGTWAPSKVTLTYQWLRDGAAIQGATKSSYKLTAADKGKKIAVRAKGSKLGYTSVTKTSSASTIRSGLLSKTPTPTVSGTAQVGKKLTAKAGTWAPSKVKLSYQWLRDGQPIEGAKSSTYILTAADKGKKVSVQVKGSKSGYSSVTKVSTATKVKSGVLTTTPIPTISGIAEVGGELTANAGVWAPSDVTLRYQWLRDGEPIDGATAPTYLVTAEDQATTLSVQVKGSKSGYLSVTTVSAILEVDPVPVAPVEAA